MAFPHRVSPHLPHTTKLLLIQPGALSHVSRNTHASDTGILTSLVVIGIFFFFLMPQSPARIKSWWYPKGYFTQKEEKIIVNSGKTLDPTH